MQIPLSCLVGQHCIIEKPGDFNIKHINRLTHNNFGDFYYLCKMKVKYNLFYRRLPYVLHNTGLDLSRGLAVTPRPRTAWLRTIHSHPLSLSRCSSGCWRRGFVYFQRWIRSPVWAFPRRCPSNRYPVIYCS